MKVAEWRIDDPNALKSMIDFIDWIQDNLHLFWNSTQEEYDTNKAWKTTREYAEVLKTQLTLSMFIPCNEKGEPMEFPKKEDYTEDELSKGKLGIDTSNYSQAKEKCWFEGFYLSPEAKFLTSPYGGVIGLISKGQFRFLRKGNEPNWGTVEDLIVEFSLLPTESLKESIGLQIMNGN